MLPVLRLLIAAMPTRQCWKQLLLGALATTGIAASGNATAQCRESTTATLAMPQSSWLRDYKVNFSAPARLAIDAADRVHIVDGGRGEVVVRAADGAVVDWRRGLGKPFSIAIDHQGRTLLGFANTGRVSTYDMEWNRLFDLGQGVGEFGQPGDMAVDPSSGEIFVTDTARHQIRVYSPGGVFSRTIGSPAAAGDEAAPLGQLRVPTGIALAGNELFVADQLNYRIQVFDKITGAALYCLGNYRSSSFVSPTSGPARAFGMLQGLWADGLGRLFVTDAFQGQVHVIETATGASIGSLGTFGDQPGELRVPTDLVIDRYGRLFVASANNNRVSVFGLDTYTDPERYLPATLNVRSAPQRGRIRQRLAEFVLSVPGQRLDASDRASLRINGAAPEEVLELDIDADGTMETVLRVDPEMLQLSLGGPGSGRNGTVTVSGRAGSRQFEASTSLALDASPDLDGDGVPNTLDGCPGTPAGRVVDAAGCGIAQRCPCRGPALGGPWRSREDFAECMRGTTQDFAGAGLISPPEAARLVRQASAGACGRTWR